MKRGTPGLLDERAAAERFGRQVVASILDHLHGPGAARTYSGASAADLDRLFDEPLPQRGGDARRALGECRRKVFRHSMQTSHPRLFGLFNPAPLPVAAFAELLAAFLNQSADAWKAAPAATHLEARLIRWINDLIGFGPAAFGVFTSGGGVANTIALKMARDRVLGRAARRAGVGRATAGRLRVYASDQAHFSIARSLDLLGIGSRALVTFPADRRMKFPAGRLAAALARDRRAGLLPAAIVATAGTTNTGNLDPLLDLARVARRAGVHFHVDAAYGGALLFSRRHRALLDGLERADTVTIDPHKWLFQPFSLGGLFVRDGRALKRAFGTEPDYLRKDLEIEGGRIDFYHYSLEGSRPFRGLKLWMTLKAIGARGLGDLVDRTMEMTAHLASAVRRSPALEIFGAPPELASVCFRYLPPWARPLSPPERAVPARLARLNRLQLAVQQQIEREGSAWFPPIVLGGAVYFRFGIFNYRTSEADIDAVLDRIHQVGAAKARSRFTPRHTRRTGPRPRT